MSQPPPDILSKDWVWPGFRRDALQLIAWGYQLTEAEIRQRHEEEDITGLIRKGINLKFDLMDDEAWSYFIKYSAKNEDPVDDGSCLGKQRPCVDILIEFSGSRPRIRYRFEAKRCARKIYNSKYKMKWYADGITDYVKGLYASDAPEAAMIGLMQSDDAAFWTSELAAHLNSVPVLGCCMPLTDADIVADLPGTSVSQHRRHNGTLINLYHIFLDCIAS